MTGNEMTSNEIRDLFTDNGFHVCKIRRWRDGQIDVVIPRSENLEAATKIGSEYGLTVCRVM